MYVSLERCKHLRRQSDSSMKAYRRLVDTHQQLEAQRLFSNNLLTYCRQGCDAGGCCRFHKVALLWAHEETHRKVYWGPMQNISSPLAPSLTPRLALYDWNSGLEFDYFRDYNKRATSAVPALNCASANGY